VFGIAVVLCVGGCGGTAPYTLGTIKTTDPDRQPTPRPDETQESMYWDRIDMSLFHQVEKPLNLNWMGQKLGQVVGGDPDEADNVNVMDEPPNSSWYQRRHFYDEMTPRELAIGPNEHDTTGTAAGPAQNGTWTVTNGKFQGASRGFQIKDPRGDRYLIKLDHPEWPELMSAAEVISTKIFYGAGYHVPQNTVTSFSLDQLKVGDEARVQTAGNKQRPMTREDLRQMLAPYGQGEDEEIRAMASKFVDGKPLGPIFFQGTRDGDKNDRVRHEQRRELRGLRVIGSWLNDVDRRHANSLAVYTDEQYVKHYLIDMGSTLGSRAGGPHRPIDGQVYLIDHRKIPQAVVSLGLYRFPWWDYDAGASYKAVGYFRADVFNPGEWVPTYPNPAFEKMTRRDAYWGAKMVMSFSDEDLKAIVETARISNPAAEDHLIEVLKARRDKVGRYWFDRINPLDRFRVADAYGAGAERSGAGAGGLQLCFDDLAVTGNLEPAEARRYTYRMVVDDEPVGEQQTVERSRLPMAVAGTALGTWLDQRNRTTEDERVVRIDLRTRQANEVSSVTRVYVHVPNDDRARVVGLERL
jgi:hypothetical protein